MRLSPEHQRRLGKQARDAEDFHRLAALVGVLGIGAIFVVRWFVDPYDDKLGRFAVDHLPHPYATIVAAAILVVGWVVIGRAGDALRQAGIVPGDAADTTVRVRPGAVIAAWQLYGTAALGVTLVWLFGSAKVTPGVDDTRVWPALAALALSEVMCVAWAWEGAALAEELKQAEEVARTAASEVVPMSSPPMPPSANILSMAPPSALTQSAPATGGPTTPVGPQVVPAPDPMVPASPLDTLLSTPPPVMAQQAPEGGAPTTPVASASGP